jgi:hypothetical protein
MDELTYCVLWTQSHTLWKDRCASTHAPGDENFDKSGARARTRQTAPHQIEWKRHTHTILLCCIVIGIYLTSHWKNDFNIITWAKIILSVIHESMCSGSITRRSSRHPYFEVTSHRHDRGRTNQDHNIRYIDNIGHEHSSYRCSPTRHCPAPSAFKNRDRHTFHLRLPLLSRSQPHKVNLSDQRHQAHHTQHNISKPEFDLL